MSNASNREQAGAWVGGASAVGGFATLGVMFFYIIHGSGNLDWQTLGMLAVSVVVASAVAAMLRFSLAPLLAPKPAPVAADGDAAIRGRIAPLVLLIGSIAIVALAMALIISFTILVYHPPAGSTLPDKIDTLLSGVFNAVLPVVATWVGTVLAFYFGSENFRQAAQSTREALSGRLTAGKNITDIMVPYERIARLEADDEKAAENSLRIMDVIHTLSAAAPRVIVFKKDAQTPIYVIRSTTPPMPPNWVTADYGKGSDPNLKDDTTLKAYLDANDGKNRDDARKFRFISANATIDDAVALMKKEGVDDLFVTKDGQSTSPVLGWLTADDLLKK